MNERILAYFLKLDKETHDHNNMWMTKNSAVCSLSNPQSRFFRKMRG